MSKIFLTLLLCLFSVCSWAANGDITACRIKGTEPGDGWVLQIDVESSGGSAIQTGGTYDFDLGTNNDPSSAKVVLTVTSLGYDTAGNATTIARTVYGTAALRKPYPDHATMNEALAAGTLTLEVALSDFVYAKDDLADNGVADITVSIASGLYTQGGTATAAYSGTVTNNSTLAYPSSVGRWAWVPYELASGSSYLLESVIFNRFAQNGKPLAAVKYTCVDEHTHSVTSSAITDMTVSTRTGDANKVLVYAYNVPTTSFTSGDVITCNFTGYPWVGDTPLNSDLVANGGIGVADPDERLTPFKFLYATSGYGAYAVVDATNGATWSSGNANVGADKASIETAYAGDNTKSWKTIGDAAKAIKDFNTATYSRAEAGGGVILLITGNHDWTGVTMPTGTQETWATVQPLTGANPVITGNANTRTLPAGSMWKVSGVAVTSSGVVFRGTAGSDHFWLHNNSFNASNSQTLYNSRFLYATDNTVTALGGGFTGGVKTSRVIRGNTSAAPITSIAYNIIGNKNVLKGTSTPTGMQPADNAVYAFNSVYNTTASPTYDLDITLGIAVVQNLIEGVSSTNMIWGPWSDGSTTASNNIIFWNNTFTGQRINAAYNDGTPTGSNWNLSKLHVNWSFVGNMFDTLNNKDDTFAPGGTKTIASITKANPGVVTSNGHGWSNGSKVYIQGVVGMTELNGTTQTIANVATNTFEIADTSAMTDYVSGGTATSANPARIGSWPVGYHVGMEGNRVANTDEFDGEFVGLNCVYGGATYGYIADYSANHGTAAGNGNYHLYSSAPAVNINTRIVLPFDLDGKRRRTEADDSGAYTRGLPKIF